MKKFFVLCAVLMSAMFMSSCTDKSEANQNPKENSTISEFKWNVTATASGEGYLSVAFPTGNIVADGLAEVSVSSTNDTIANNRAAFSNAPSCESVLANPTNYDNETVEFAKQVNSAFYVDSISGKWNVDITGYAKYGMIYIVIDEHFPKE